MRLLCCSGSLDGGGSERQLWQLASRIDPSRFDSHVYLHYLRGRYLERLPESIPVHAFWPDFGAPKTLIPGQIHRAQVKHLAQTIQREKIDVVYDRTFHMTLTTAPACHRTNTPRVSVIVSPPSQDFARSNEKFSWLKKRLLARAYNDRSAITLAVSTSVADDAATFYGIPRPKIKVIPSPVDRDEIVAEASKTISKTAQRSGSLRVVVVGRLSSEKGQEYLLRAVALADASQKRVELDVVGDGPLRAQLEALAQELDIADQVRFWGFRENPYPIMRTADAICIPSDYEGLPNVALEAMTLRTPVVATNCSGSVRELIGEDQRGILVPCQNPDAFAKELSIFSRESDLWTDRINAAEQWVNKHHGLQHWLDSMSELLQKHSGKGDAK